MNKLKQIIQDELLKRGFTAKITQFDIEHDRSISISTEEFNTTPVIMKSIKIQSAGWSHCDNGGMWSIGLKVRYEHFNGGSNGCDLFAIFIQQTSNDDFILNSVR